MIKEVCVENFTNIPAAVQAGANRIELNDNLAVGGTTVSKGVMAAAAAYTREAGIPLVAMIRPRGGDFVYTDEEIAMMIGDLRTAKECGVPSVTFCAVTPAGRLDVVAIQELLDAAQPLEVVCHMGFDAINLGDQQEAMNWLIAHGVQRILTHGGPMSASITDNLPQLKALVEMADDRIEILPGGGITAANVDEIVATLHVTQAHGTKIIDY